MGPGRKGSRARPAVRPLRRRSGIRPGNLVKLFPGALVARGAALIRSIFYSSTTKINRRAEWHRVASHRCDRRAYPCAVVGHFGSSRQERLRDEGSRRGWNDAGRIDGYWSWPSGPRAWSPLYSRRARTEARPPRCRRVGEAEGVDEGGEGDPDVHQGRRPDPPGEVPELPPPPPGRAVRPGDLRAGAEAVQRHRRGDRGAVDAAVEADAGRRPEAQARPVADASRDRHPRRLGRRRAPRRATPRTCRRRPSSPRAGSSGRPTWSSSRPRTSPSPPRARTSTAASSCPPTWRRTPSSRRSTTRPGNRGVVHHIIAYIDTTGRARQLDAGRAGAGLYHVHPGPGIEADELGFWTAGSEPHRLPDGRRHPRPRQSDIILQVHYHPTGKAGGRPHARRPLLRAQAGQAGPALEQRVELRLPAPRRRRQRRGQGELVSSRSTSRRWPSRPHMHQLGRDMRMSVTLPGRHARKT